MMRSSVNALSMHSLECGGLSYWCVLNDLLNLIDTLILGIELPNAVVTAINKKIEQHYIAEEYRFRVCRYCSARAEP